MLQNVEDEENFLQLVLFSDEAAFHKSDAVNWHII